VEMAQGALDRRWICEEKRAVRKAIVTFDPIKNKLATCWPGRGGRWMCTGLLSLLAQNRAEIDGPSLQSTLPERPLT